MRNLLFLILLGSCAAPKPSEKIPGYFGPKLDSVVKQLQGKSRQEARIILGNPAVAGRCQILCGPKDIYRMIYPTRDMDRFYLDITANTDEVIDCVIFDFYPNRKTQRFEFQKNSMKLAKDCNNKDGEIQFLKTYMTNENGRTKISK